MTFKSFKPLSAKGEEPRCPDCGCADDIIRWGNGWCCRDCGYEWK